MLHNYYHFFRMEISQKSVNVIYRCIKLSLKIYPFYSLQKKCMSVKKKMTLLIFDLEREWMGVRFTVDTFPLTNR